MTTYTGNAVTIAGSTTARLIVDITHSPTTVTSSTASVTVSWGVDVQTLNGYGNGNDTVTVTGDDAFGPSVVSWSTTGHGDRDDLTSGSEVVNLIYGQTQVFDLDVTLTDVGPSTNDATISCNYTIPARPYVVPTAPSGLVVTRVSDTSQSMTWTRNATTAGAYLSQEIWRSTNGASAVKIATVAGTATSYTDGTTAKGNRYGYFVKAVNTSGSASSGTDGISTTPNTPAAPTATKESNGDITVARPASPPYNVADWQVQESTNGGSTWSAAIATIPAGTSTWTHVAPNAAVTHTYRVVYRSADPVLSSTPSAASNTIQLQAPPAAPTNLAPSVADATDTNYVTWQHNPVDGTPQTQYEMRHRPVGGIFVSFGITTSTSSIRTIPAGTWTNGTDREIQVRTRGAHATFGPWSATLLIDLTGRPVPGITSPSGTWSSQVLTASWTYYDPAGLPQAAWKAELLEAGNIIDTKQGNTPGTSTTFAVQVANGGTYTLRVSVKNGAGLWSTPVEETFTVTYAPPATPTVTATWHDDDGAVTVDVSVPSPVSPERPLDHIRVERQDVDDPDVWWIVADDVTTNPATITDHIAPTGTVATYRAVAVSDIGSLATTTATVDTDTAWAFVNYGPGFGSVVRFDSDLSAGRGLEPFKELKWYAGRTHPVVRVGEGMAEEYQMSATIYRAAAANGGQSTWRDLHALLAADVVCVRDPLGARMFATATGASEGDRLTWESKVSVTFARVDHHEAAVDDEGE